MKLTTAVRRGDKRKILETLRDKIAATIENSESGRDIAALSKRLMEVNEELEALPVPDQENKSKHDRLKEKLEAR